VGKELPTPNIGDLVAELLEYDSDRYVLISDAHDRLWTIGQVDIDTIDGECILRIHVDQRMWTDVDIDKALPNG